MSHLMCIKISSEEKIQFLKIKRNSMLSVYCFIEAFLTFPPTLPGLIWLW